MSILQIVMLSGPAQSLTCVETWLVSLDVQNFGDGRLV